MASPSKDFSDFQIQEYEKIAEAHFKANDAISLFFRYYILLMSVPLSAFVVMITLPIGQIFYPIIGLLFIVVALIGISMMLYVTSLRSDVMLYARTINAVRRYFYDHSQLNPRQRKNYMVLPDDKYFFVGADFYPVVSVFTILNTSYTLAGILILDKTFEKFIFKSSEYSINDDFVYFAVLAGISIITHLLLFEGFRRSRDPGYLFKQPKTVLGVDIDGVLNDHRRQFAKIFYEQTRRTINPDAIIKLPVHRHVPLGISEKEEKNVFNSPDYWADMPPLNDASKQIQKIKNSLNVKIWIFTSRPWPEQRHNTLGEFQKILKEWRTKLVELKKQVFDSPGHIFRNRAVFMKRHTLKRRHMLERYYMSAGMTLLWLCKHEFPFDKLIVERTSELVPENRTVG